MTRTQLINIIRQSITDALARQNTAGVVRGVLETLVNGMPNEDDPSQVGSYLPPITEDEYGVHPAAPTGADQIEYLYRRLGNVAPVIIPKAPSNGAVDDQGNTFSFDISAGYTSAAEYEYTEPNATGGIVKLTALNSYINGTRVTITGLTGPIPTGQLKVRVAANGAVSAGYWLASTAPFTGTAGSSGGTPTKAPPPFFGVIDDVNDTVTLDSQYAYDQVRWGVEGQGPQTLGSNSICSPGNIAGRLYAYVIADASKNRLQSDTVYSSAFTLAANPNTIPTASLSVLGGTSSVTPGQTVTLVGLGQDSDTGDSVVRLDFLDNGTKIGEVTGASGNFVTPGLTAGTHNFTLRATDTRGATGLSSAVIVTSASTPTPGIDASNVNSITGGTSIMSNSYGTFDAKYRAKIAARYSQLGRTGGITSYHLSAVPGQRILAGNGEDKAMRPNLQSQIYQYLDATKLNLITIDGPTNELSNCVVFGSDLSNTTASSIGYTNAAQTCFDRFQAMLAEIRAYCAANNFAIIIVTGSITPRYNPIIPQPGFENERLKYNQLLTDALANGTAKFDRRAYVGEDYRSTHPGPDPSGSSLYYQDPTHPNENGYDTIWVPNFEDAATSILLNRAQSAAYAGPPVVAPTISSFSPASAPPGATITVTGTGFTGLSSVLLGTEPANGFAVLSDTSFTFTVPVDGATNKITATNASGTATSANSLTVTAAAPTFGAYDGPVTFSNRTAALQTINGRFVSSGGGWGVAMGYEDKFYLKRFVDGGPMFSITADDNFFIVGLHNTPNYVNNRGLYAGLYIVNDGQYGFSINIIINGEDHQIGKYTNDYAKYWFRRSISAKRLLILGTNDANPGRNSNWTEVVGSDANYGKIPANIYIDTEMYLTFEANRDAASGGNGSGPIDVIGFTAF